MAARKIHRAKPAEEQESDSEERLGAFTAATTPDKRHKWLIVSGASSHMTPRKYLLKNYEEFKKPEKVCLGDGRTVEAFGAGETHLTMKFKVSKPKPSVMYRVLYVPKLSCNLFSVRAAADRGNVKANSVVSPSNQWERFDQPEGYRLFTVMFVDQ